MLDRDQLIKRFKAFLWQTGMMLVAALIQFVLDNLNLLHLSPEVTVVIGLVLGQVSKMLNTQTK